MSEDTKQVRICPFCGTEAVNITTEHHDNANLVLAPRFYVQCLQCLARGGYGETPAEAVEMWNLRTKVTAYGLRGEYE